MPIPPHTPDDRYRAEQRRAVLDRVRLLAHLGLVAIVLDALASWWAFSGRVGEHLASLEIQTAINAVGLLLARQRRSERWAITLALGLTIGSVTAQAAGAWLAGGKADVLTSAILGIMLFTALMFPWGGVPQAIASSYAVACAATIPDWHGLDPARTVNTLTMLALGLTTSVAGAFVLDQQRRATFVERERVAALAGQRELLIDAGRALNATIDLDALVQLIAHLAHRLVGCDGAALALPDPGGRVFRTVALSLGPHLPPLAAEQMEGAVALAARGMLDPEVAAVTQPDERFLTVPILRDGRLLGILTLIQADPEHPFSDQSRQLADGLAHQAAIAIANAQLVQDLTRASQVKSEFVSTMSHELRTPLAVILGFAEMAIDASFGLEEKDHFLRKVVGAGQDLLDLVESTLALGRLDAGRDEPELERVSLASLWDDLHGHCARLPRAATVTLDWQPGAPGHDAVTDPRKLQVVARNLVGNALKFTEQGHVRVAIAVDEDRFVLSVADTGIGIQPADRSRIFEMFHQGDGSDSRRFGGTGLGLYIVQKYVTQLGGTVALESTPGVGSTFRVTLPLDAAAAGRCAA